ncbi:hypothetical protein N9N03_02170 [Chlamydiia bacterium]|jgi:hypothetical protein|nr:hypothetical protein [Chlamydiia bacterium]
MRQRLLQIFAIMSIICSPIYTDIPEFINKRVISSATESLTKHDIIEMYKLKYLFIKIKTERNGQKLDQLSRSDKIQVINQFLDETCTALSAYEAILSNNLTISDNEASYALKTIYNLTPEVISTISNVDIKTVIKYGRLMSAISSQVYGTANFISFNTIRESEIMSIYKKEFEKQYHDVRFDVYTLKNSDVDQLNNATHELIGLINKHESIPETLSVKNTTFNNTTHIFPTSVDRYNTAALKIDLSLTKLDYLVLKPDSETTEVVILSKEQTRSPLISGEMLYQRIKMTIAMQDVVQEQAYRSDNIRDAYPTYFNIPQKDLLKQLLNNG